MAEILLKVALNTITQTLVLVSYINITLKKKSDSSSNTRVYLRNNSWKPECVGSFNMDWQILVFYPELEARNKIYKYPPIHVKTQSTFWLP